MEATMESVRNLKVNLKVEGTPCRACQLPLKLADDAAICTGCNGEHHRRCWETSGGCATPACVNAPLRRLDGHGAGAGLGTGFAPPRVLAPGMMHCPNCRNEIAAGSLLCPLCGVITSPDGIYHGPKVNAPGAVASLVYGIIGLLFCGVVFGPIAISKANAAKRAMASNPTFSGSGLATAGMVLGIIDLVAFAILMVAKMGAS